jgi:hypothetical protein
LLNTIWEHAKANDGYLKTWLNDTEVIDYGSIGLLSSLDTGMTGTLYFDGFVSQGTDTLVSTRTARSFPHHRTDPRLLPLLHLPLCRS